MQPLTTEIGDGPRSPVARASCSVMPIFSLPKLSGPKRFTAADGAGAGFSGFVQAAIPVIIPAAAMLTLIFL